MRTLDEILEFLVHTCEAEELVELLDIPTDVLLERFDDYVERHMEKIEDEYFTG